MEYVWAGAGLVLIGLLLYARYTIVGLRVDAANVAPLTQALHDQSALVSAKDAEIAGLHAKARELDEKEAKDIVASGDAARAIGFLRASFPDSKDPTPRV